MGSLDFIPDNLQEEELYQFLSELIDEVLGGEAEFDYHDALDSRITSLLPEFTDELAVLAYYNTLIRPILGTRTAIELLLDLLNIDSVLTEWFELSYPFPHYKFLIDVGEIPTNLSVETFIDLVYLVKNERSHLAVISTEDCAGMLILDYGYLDNEYMDDLQGAYINGTNVCIIYSHGYAITLEDSQIYKSETGIDTEVVSFEFGDLLDYMYLDDLSKVLPPIEVIRGSITSIWFTHTDISAVNYHTGTFVCQIVFDDYGELDDGTGFLGGHQDFEETQSLDEFSLSDNPVIWIVHGCEWVIRDYEVDRTSILQSVIDIWSENYQRGVLLEDPLVTTASMWSQLRTSVYEFHRFWEGPWEGYWTDPYSPLTYTIHTQEDVE